jgi:putative flippase GtrA
MRKNFWGEIAVSVLLIILLFVFFKPSGASAMSMPGLMTVSAGLIVAFAVFAAFVWREDARDEREELHRLIANRTAFLAGVFVLVLGVIVQAFAHASDPWLVATLAAMVLAKVAGLIYSRMRR